MKDFTGFKKGVNLGGWLSQCEGKYNHEHYQTYFTKKDLEVIAGYGCDHVRLPIDYNVIQEDDGTLKEDGFVYIDNCLEWCKELGLNTVIDLHKTCGFVFDDESYCHFFTDEKLQDQFVYLWQELSKRYGNIPTVAFELLNEITMPEMAEPWNEIIKKTAPKIREIAPKVPIIVGGIYNSSIGGLALMEKPCTNDMVYTFHCYSPFIFTHQAGYWVKNMPADYRCSYPLPASVMKAESQKVFADSFDDEYEPFGDAVIDYKYFVEMFSNAAKMAEEYDVPLYCGEYGVIDIANAANTLTWFEDIHKAFDELNVARCVWTYKEMDFGITQEHLAPIYDRLVELIGK